MFFLEVIKWRRDEKIGFVLSEEVVVLVVREVVKKCVLDREKFLLGFY